MITQLCRTEFSLGESVLKAEKAPAIAQEQGYNSLIVADTMSISSIIPAQLAAEKLDGFSVICGARLLIVDNPFYEHEAKAAKERGEEVEPLSRKQTYSLTALIKNQQGFVDLCELLTAANEREQFYFTPRLALDQVIECYSKGNILLLTSDTASLFFRDDSDSIIDTIIAAGGADNFIAAAYPITTPLYDQLNKRTLEAADKFGLRKVAYSPAYYESNSDADLKDVAYMVCNNIKADQEYRLRIPFQRDSGIGTRATLLRKLGDFSKRMGVPVSQDMVIANQEWIAAQCEWRWHKLDISLPKLFENEEAELTKLAVAGLRYRFANPSFGYTPPKELHPVYVERLKYELEVLKKLGFCGYFLVVNDVMEFARTFNVAYGCGRGSVGGSLVAFALRITEVDPIRFDLLFERFINPSRLDLPDADLDFSQARRTEIFDYLTNKYGRDFVAAIPNYMYLGAASALRDSARVFNLDAGDLAASKEITIHGDGCSLEEGAESLTKVGDFAKKNPEIFEFACKLQSVMRGYGRHAAGVIVAGDKLTNRAVVELRNGERCINWDKRHCEDMGLVKLDILGLATLDLIELACNYVQERHGKKLVPYEFALDDDKVLDSFAQGRTTAIFQFESGGMRKTLKDLGNGLEPLTFETLIATTALFRPGPMQSGALDTFVSVAKGYEDPESIHPLLEDVTLPTNGVMVYQEQTMQAVQIMAGFSLAEADLVRKAMGKKDLEKMKSLKEQFVKGCAEVNGVKEITATDVWDKIEKFAGYGFNKSHSAAYALLSYCSAYMKTYYPAEFFAAALTILPSDKHPAIVKDARDHGIEIYPPCINHSSNRLEIGYDAKREQTVLYAPFDAVKGCSSAGSKAIVEARAKCGGSFDSIEQFELTVEKRKCNSRVRDNLKKVGAYANVDPKELEPLHPDRRKDQAEIMGDLVIDTVSSVRKFHCDAKVCAQVNSLHTRMAKETEYGDDIVRPSMGKDPKVMVVLDGVNGWDAKAGYVGANGYDDLKNLFNEAGFKQSDIYLTAICKVPKDKETGYKTAQINEFKRYFEQELGYTKPPVILALGSLSAGYFSSSKVKPSELSGRCEFNTALDATIIYGFNPSMLFFKPEKKEELGEIISKAYSACYE